jgi:flagellar basal-body rod modification protein FlgD
MTPLLWRGAIQKEIRMSINTLSEASTAAPSSSLNGLTGQKEVVDKQDFLMLLVTQLKNQDPLSPMDGTEFTAQLAQFSALEQLQSINAKMDQFVATHGMAPNGAAIDYIGKTVTVDGQTVTIEAGKAADIVYSLSGDASQTILTISDATGQVVRSMSVGALSAGQQTTSWDGNDDNGQPLPAGSYQVRVDAIDALGRPVGTSGSVTARVTGVSFENGITTLLAGDKKLPLGSVTKVIESPVNTANAATVAQAATGAVTAASAGAASPSGSPVVEAMNQVVGLARTVSRF